MTVLVRGMIAMVIVAVLQLKMIAVYVMVMDLPALLMLLSQLICL